MASPSTVGFVSLGCPKALVDSEEILTRLRAEGYAIAPDYEKADLVVVNTCGFIESAIEESLDAIGEALRENGKVVVTGCLGGDASKIRGVYPAVLAVTGPHAANEVMDAIHAHLPAPHDPFTSLVPPQGIRLTPKHFAYLKISEGCNHRCTFCIIPTLRGDLASRPVGSVMREAETLVKAGVKEILVISQDTSAYGVDIQYRTDFWGGRPTKSHITDLAKALGSLDAWVRLHYVYPYPHVDELIPLMTTRGSERGLLPYLDIPFQHASARILKLMKRPAAAEKTLERLTSWRAINPDLTIRSTFIVGFPGETESEFQALLDFVEAAQIDRLGAFPYSPVAGARANELPDPVPEDIKAERLARLMALQEHISARKLAGRVGQSVKVLVDALVSDEAGHLVALARSFAEAPDIDGVIQIDEPGRLKAGEFADVRITDADEHDLWAVPVDT